MRLIALLLGLALAPLLHAQESWSGVSDVTFKGYSTLHQFAGTVKGVPLKAVVSQGKNGRVVSATSDVKVRQMNTQNEKRDANMMTMFNEAEHHLIKVEVAGAEENSLRPQRGKPGTMPVTLTIAGRRGTVNGAVTNVSELPDSVAFDLGFPVSLAAFNLDPPKAIGGLMKVKDTIEVSVRVKLRKDIR